MSKDFDVLNPSIENIEYVFKNILYYLTCSLYCEEYQNYKDRIQEILDTVKGMIEIYETTRKLANINHNVLNDTKDDLIILQDDIFGIDFKDYWSSYYIEWVGLWFQSLIILRNTEIQGGENAKG